MKYKRNSGRSEQTTKEPESGKRNLTLSAQELVGRRLLEDAQWIDELSKTEKYSFEWVHNVLVELLFQCMGKKEVLMGFKGEEKLLRVFKEKPALEIVGMIAKMNGHLFDVIKGTINKNISGTVEHNHTIELKPDANRTVEVFEILEACGVFQPPVKQLSDSEVEQVHTA